MKVEEGGNGCGSAGVIELLNNDPFLPKRLEAPHLLYQQPLFAQSDHKIRISRGREASTNQAGAKKTGDKKARLHQESNAPGASPRFMV
jgi:hypothetical protein